MKLARRYVPGLVPPLVIGAIAYGVGHVVPVLGGPIVAILLGLLVGQFAGQRDSWEAGTAFAGKKILQASIVTLGATMSLGQVASTGGRTFPVLFCTLVVALAGGSLLASSCGSRRSSGRSSCTGRASAAPLRSQR